MKFSGDHPVIESLMQHYAENEFVTITDGPPSKGGHVVTFEIQNGPIKEVGENGCQIDEVIRFAEMFIEGLNQKFPCRENSLVITKLDEALLWLEARTKDREARGVEGFDKR